MAAHTGKKNTHLEHLEDDIINLGYAGAQQSIAFVEALLQLFEGTAPNKLSISVKWDGAPAIVCGKDPETGYFFVATKHKLSACFCEQHFYKYLRQNCSGQYWAYLSCNFQFHQCQVFFF